MTAPRDPLAPPASASPVTPSIRVLIAEDEANLGTILEQFMLARGFMVTIVRNGRDAVAALRAERFDVALLDIVMPELDGLEVLRQVRSEALPPEVIVITGNGTMETALAAMKAGAYDFLSKPYRMAEIEALVRRAWEKRVLARQHAAFAQRLAQLDPEPVIDTEFAPMRAVLSLVNRVAATDSPLLVTGERGSGKESLARYVHARSHRAHEVFVRVDAAGDMQAALLGSAFGDTLRPAPASLSGITSSRAGVHAGAVEVAALGTLYVDGIEQLDADGQRLLLEALVRGYLTRAADGRRVPWSARVIASSTADDDTLATRLDPALVRLLETVRVTLPPLRDRLVDLPVLATRFLERADTPKQLAPAALDQLMAYTWPGNIGELRLVLERAALRTNTSIIEPQHLALASTQAVDNASDLESALVTANVTDLAGLERRHIARVLEHTGWHQGRAAELLGISPKTLYRKIREFGFRRPGSRRD